MLASVAAEGGARCLGPASTEVHVGDTGPRGGNVADAGLYATASHEGRSLRRYGEAALKHDDRDDERGVLAWPGIFWSVPRTFGHYSHENYAQAGTWTIYLTKIRAHQIMLPTIAR